MNFREQFSQFVVPGENDVKSAIENGLIVLDTNVLFSAYRYAPHASEELLSALEKARSRIWIPHQVGLEFYRNRMEVITTLKSSYSSVRAHLAKSESKVVQELQERLNELFKRVSLSDEEKNNVQVALGGAFDPLKEALNKLEDSHTFSGSLSDDPILKRLEKLFDGSVGLPFNETEDVEHRSEAKRRTDNRLPPGYLDSDKEASHGDYFVWLQTLIQAKAVEAKILLFVTGDEKNDWYQQVNHKNICARPELAAEAKVKAGCRLVMMNTSQFLTNAKRFLDAKVSDETIRQAQLASTVFPTHLATSNSFGLPTTLSSHARRNMLEDKCETLSNEIMKARQSTSQMQTEITQLRNRIEYEEVATKGAVELDDVSTLVENVRLTKSMKRRLFELEGELNFAFHQETELIDAYEQAKTDLVHLEMLLDPKEPGFKYTGAWRRASKNSASERRVRRIIERNDEPEEDGGVNADSRP